MHLDSHKSHFVMKQGFVLPDFDQPLIVDAYVQRAPPYATIKGNAPDESAEHRRLCAPASFAETHSIL